MMKKSRNVIFILLLTAILFISWETLRVTNDSSGSSLNAPSTEHADAKSADIDPIPITTTLQMQDGNSTYSSPTGYSVTFPGKYTPRKIEGLGNEQMLEGYCQIYFSSDDSMGHLAFRLTNSNLNDVREYFQDKWKTYDVSTQIIIVAGRESELVEVGPIGDSGSGSYIFVPTTSGTLIVSHDWIGKDSPEMVSVINSLKFTSLDISQCGK